MIEGMQRYSIKKIFDERGFFLELFRKDWKEILHDDDVVQYNLSYSYPGIIRAWHRHLRGQNDYFICIKGAIKVCGFDDRKTSSTKGELDEIVLNGDSPEIIRMPGNVWHGYKVVGVEPAFLLYGVNRLYDYDDPDEERRSWNDESITPRTINGKTNDPRIGKPWDWYSSPNK